MDKVPSNNADDVLSELRKRASTRTLDRDDVAYRARVASRTLRRWVAGETGTPSPMLVERLRHTLAAA